MLKRRSSRSNSAQLELCTAIKLQHLPPNTNSKLFLQRHFRQFGQIVKVTPRPKADYAIIEFADHESAKAAKESSTTLIPDTSSVKMFFVLPSVLLKLKSQLSPTGTVFSSEKFDDKLETHRNTRSVKTSDVAERFAARSLKALGAVAAGGSRKKPTSTPADFRNVEKPSQIIKIPEIAKKQTVAFEETGNIMFEAENVHSLVSQLKQLIGKQAVSTYDKLQLLEQRDKIIRKYRVKVNEVNKAATFKGACPDMCPEKERYRREVQILLHPLETLPPPQSGVDHVRAVKDYARSSADQEEPLPHDLRPSEILEKTMHYLISQIIVREPDSDDNQLVMWYDFLWNRTRAIRKDITQQMLNDVRAVSLIEQCVRFHIYAAHRLCELDIGVFDQKMNTENLRKSLLSLRHMYEDLHKSNMACCENESEFRCYDVLLNLNDSNILRQVLTFEDSVRQSEPIRFALKLFLALQNKNYVSFFRLIRQRATYLQACIAHRYFADVRSEALKIIVRAFSGGSTNASYTFPVNDLTKTLSFENDSETLQFCSSFNITPASYDQSILLLNRSMFCEPELPVISKRYLNLIGSKRDKSTAEIISGSPIQPFTYITPVVSFDSDHRYVNDTVVKNFLDAIDPHALTAEDIVAVMAPPKATTISKSVDIEDEAVKQVASDLLATVVKSCVTKVVVSEFNEKFSIFYVSILVDALLREITDHTYTEQRTLAIELQRKKREHALFVQTLSVEFRDQLLDIGIPAYITEIVSEEYRTYRNVWKLESQRSLDALGNVMGDNLVRSVVDNEMKRICMETFDLKVSCRKSTLHRIRQKLELLSLRKCVDFWRQKTRRRKRVREMLADFPTVPGCSSVYYANFTSGSDNGTNYVEKSSSPKRIRLTSYRDCLSPSCCQLRSTQADADRNSKRWSDNFSNNTTMVADGLNGNSKQNQHNRYSANNAYDKQDNDDDGGSWLEIRGMLDSLKRGVKIEKMLMEEEKQAFQL